MRWVFVYGLNKMHFREQKCVFFNRGISLLKVFYKNMLQKSQVTMTSSIQLVKISRGVTSSHLFLKLMQWLTAFTPLFIWCCHLQQRAGTFYSTKSSHLLLNKELAPSTQQRAGTFYSTKSWHLLNLDLWCMFVCNARIRCLFCHFLVLQAKSFW